jgi:hypothetical protein
MARVRSKKTELALHMKQIPKFDPNNDLDVSIVIDNFNIPVKHSQQLELLKEYVEWSFTTTASNPIDFPLSKRINPYNFYLLRFKNKLFADMIEFVKYSFVSKLEHNPVVSGDYTSKRIRYYDREYGDWVRSEITQALKAHSDIKVMMEPIPTSTLVPRRNDPETDHERKKDD